MHCQMCGKTAQEMWELQDLAIYKESTFYLQFVTWLLDYILVSLFLKKLCFTWHTIYLQNSS